MPVAATPVTSYYAKLSQPFLITFKLHPHFLKQSTLFISVTQHDMVLDDWRMKVRQIAETIGISKECVGYILHEQLDMKKLCARWVPRLLTAHQKRTHMKISEQCLEHFNKNKTDFVHQFITMDETWIHHYTPGSKQQSKQWIEAGCLVPKKTRSVPSAGKVMASVFWDTEGILFID
jgi:histone-lysine N-methyltransferase SETMAR